MSSGTGDKLRGMADDAKGRVKETVGNATDNESLQGEGMADQVKGKGKGLVGDVKDGLDKAGDKVGDAVDNIRKKKA